MSDWILYDDFVDLMCAHHQNRFSGLITGVSDSRHSFQLGFDRGQIVLLSYRIRKGQQALDLMTQIQRAKISEHPNTEIQRPAVELPDTSAVLSQLTANTLDQTSVTATDISDLSAPRSQTSPPRAHPLDARLRKVIENAAMHHFGPTGAMVCAEHLRDASSDLRQVVLGIAEEVGANEADTRAFFQTVSNA